ncbi:DUF433 domain-containing protein [Echinicola sp. 20G]|uniref:DUF433 domain-containing protein n=1 Tax=Echinicola sp. 20G TaxID=2781961 RepID=UPI00191054BB|nr:DUF433 domain-containing protein [Echinicola sp. 20G]
MEFENKLKIGIGIYTVSKIATILRQPYAKVNRWVKEYWDGKLGAQFQSRYSWEVDKSKAVSFHTLIEFYVMVQFAEAGVQTKKVLQAHLELSKLFNTAFPFAQKKVIDGIRTDGCRVYVQHEGGTVSLDGTKQLNLDFIALFFKKLEFDADQLASGFWPMGKEKSIFIDPKRKFGHPVIDGHNIYPETIFSHFQAGDPVEYIAYVYDLTEKQVKDALEFCKAA